MSRHALAASARSAALALAVLSAGGTSAAALEFVESDGTVLVVYPLQADDRWCLLWNHSVAGFAVRDCFVYRPPAIILEHSHQPDFAAGLGYVAGRGTLRPDGRGGYRIEGIDEPLRGNVLLLRVGSITVDHRVEFGGAVSSLSAVAANRRVVMRVVAD